MKTRTFNLLLILVYLLGGCLMSMAVEAWGTTYYVDSALTDTHAASAVPDCTVYNPVTFLCSGGTSSAYTTVADINTMTTLTAGNQVFFRRGREWRDAKLVIPSSGLVGNPLQFASYGTGSNPIINGSDVKSMATATIVPSGYKEIFTGTAGSDLDDGAQRDYRSLFSAGSISGNASNIKIRIYAASGSTDLTIDGSAIGPQAGAGDVFDASSLTRITWDGGSNTTTIAHGSYKDSDAITYNLDSSKNQLVTMYIVSRHFKASTGTTLYYKSGVGDESQTSDVSTYLNIANNGFVRNIYGNVSYLYTYQISQASDPVVVWENGIALSLQTSIAMVESTAGSWWWDSGSNLLYVHASDGSNIITNGKLYEIGSSRTECIDDNGQSYVTVDGIDTVQTASSDSYLGGIKLTGSHNIVKNLTTHDHRRHALSFYTGGHDNVASNVKLYNTFSISLVNFYGSGTADNTLENSTLYNSGVSSNGSIVVHGGAVNSIIQNNDISNSGTAVNPVQCVRSYDAGTGGTIIRNNTFHGWASNLLDITANYGLQVYLNIVDSSLFVNSLVSLNTSTGSAIYNNDFSGSASTKYCLVSANSSSATKFKNNICTSDKFVSIDTTSEVNTTIDYNDYYSANATPFSWGGAGYSFTDWKTNTGQDVHSINADPLFVSPGTDFHLKAASPYIDAGVNVGLTSDYDGRSIPTRNNNYPIGAFGFTRPILINGRLMPGI